MSKGPDKTHRIAVIGPHRRGAISRMAHQPERGFVITDLCGHSGEGLERYSERCGGPPHFTRDYREITENPEIEVVFVCSPDYLHREHACAALEAGKTVFLEKPMAIRIEDCDSILKAAETPGARLYVGHNMRFFPVMRKMRELIEEGAVGEVEAVWCRHFVGRGGDYYFKNYNSEREYSTSLLLQKGAHDIDMIHWFGGAFTRRVTGMGKLSVFNRVTDRRGSDLYADRAKPQPEGYPPMNQRGLNPVIDVEDHNMLLLQLENGVQACYLECFYTRDYHRNYTVIGTEGRMENYGDHSSREHEASVHLWNRHCTYEETGHEVFPVPVVDGTHGGADPLMIEDFLTFIETGVRCGAEPVAARMAAVVGCCGAESLRDGSRPVDIPGVAAARSSIQEDSGAFR